MYKKLICLFVIFSCVLSGMDHDDNADFGYWDNEDEDGDEVFTYTGATLFPAFTPTHDKYKGGVSMQSIGIEEQHSLIDEELNKSLSRKLSKAVYSLPSNKSRN